MSCSLLCLFPASDPNFSCICELAQIHSNDPCTRSLPVDSTSQHACCVATESEQDVLSRLFFNVVVDCVFLFYLNENHHNSESYFLPHLSLVF